MRGQLAPWRAAGLSYFEAIRQYAAAQRGTPAGGDAPTRLGAARLKQLRRDLELSPEARVTESEDVVAVGSPHAAPLSPRTFASYDAFVAWRRQREAR